MGQPNCCQQSGPPLQDPTEGSCCENAAAQVSPGTVRLSEERMPRHKSLRTDGGADQTVENGGADQTVESLLEGKKCEIRCNVTLTDSALEAALKMQCDLTGAVYSIYWINIQDVHVVAASYVTNERRKVMREKRGDDRTFADTCAEIKLDAKSLIAKVADCRESAFIPDARNCPPFPREKIAKEFDVKSVCVMPFQDGVLEYGTGTSATWKRIPEVSPMPLEEMQKALEKHGAIHIILWVQKGDLWEVASDYVKPARLKALKSRRGDDCSFPSESRGMKLSADSMIGKLGATGKPGDYNFVEDADEDPAFERMALAKEFDVKHIKVLLCRGGGVLEYGVPADIQLTGNTLAATLKMACDMCDAVYSLYWVGVDGEYVVAGDYVTPERREEMRSRRADNRTFAGSCAKLSLNSESLVAKVATSGEERYIESAATCPEFPRGDLASEYGIECIRLMPVTGGVLEFGTGEKYLRPPDNPILLFVIPKKELKSAFEVFGAVYTIIWSKKAGKWIVISDFVTPERREALRNARGDGDTFPSRCRALQLGDDSVIARCAKSKARMVITNADESADFERLELAQEFGVKSINVVPVLDTILEYGVAVITDRAAGSPAPPKPAPAPELALAPPEQDNLD